MYLEGNWLTKAGQTVFFRFSLWFPPCTTKKNGLAGETTLSAHTQAFRSVATPDHMVSSLARPVWPRETTPTPLFAEGNLHYVTNHVPNIH